MATILGFDYGNKKIGVAVGQDVILTSNPLKIVKNDGSLWNEMDAIFKDWNAKIAVIGQPELKDGTRHPLEAAIEKFIYQLIFRYNVITYREKEAYSSCEAAQVSLSRKGVRSADDYAAAIILESWMRANY